ncbi:type IVB secretion system protein IcmH/DotU [uncultured Helicobacter sp.]|uniref:type IVB secretion system protein IcmH/DotU n=1 Tax=uncultured Helicobacter sp. TaxID=175537 RepID=UPI0026095DB8|nr:type IVB secretion system protein IcmH/DotU [uncultured Helicobacter sp.]
MEESNLNRIEPSLLLNHGFCGLLSNKVLDHSLELLLLSSRLSKIDTLETSKIEAIKEKMINDILAISSKLSTYKEYEEKDIVKLRYCLCVFMDEIIMKNELFMNSSWAHSTLTVRLFDETLGGDNFYDIALSWLNNPAKNKNFLEFVYACLVLGYKGKYSSSKDVNERISLLCENIASAITPLLNTDENIAFSKACDIDSKETLGSKFQRLYLKKILILLPLLIIVLIFSYLLLDLETNNIRVENKIEKMIEDFTNKKES